MCKLHSRKTLKLLRGLRFGTSIILQRGGLQLLVCAFVCLSHTAYAYKKEFVSAKDPRVHIILNFGEEAQPLPLNKLISLDVVTQVPAGLAIKLLKFDARMPEHFHGMNVTPQLKPIDAKLTRIDGVKLHMQGEWLLTLIMLINKREETFSVTINVRE